MAKAKTTKINSTVYGAKKSASLDHWYGKDQHVGTGVSTDPEMQEGCNAGVTRTSGKEPQTPVI